MLPGIGAAGAFLSSPLTKAVGAMLIAVVALSYAYNEGKSRAEADCAAAALQSEVDALRRDLAAAQAAERDAERLAAQAEAREQELTERLTDYERDLEAGGEPDVCLLDRGDVDSLRKLAR